jgi:hypothetical protein
VQFGRGHPAQRVVVAWLRFTANQVHPIRPQRHRGVQLDIVAKAFGGRIRCATRTVESQMTAPATTIWVGMASDGIPSDV